MQANDLTRRAFLGATTTLALGALLPRRLLAIGPGVKVDIVQLVYAGGNWRPRPTAIRRLWLRPQSGSRASVIVFTSSLAHSAISPRCSKQRVSERSTASSRISDCRARSSTRLPGA